LEIAGALGEIRAMRTDRPLAAAFDTYAFGRSVTGNYENRAIATVNDHEIRISFMTETFRWHRHPDSDETFLAVDGEMVIEFEQGEAVLKPGELLTVPRGVLHRTRPGEGRSVNLTFERRDAATIFEERD
jgi:mannose-6-phosphate isomerase-like protein (cupin superfamily)